ncbi:MAG: hypothetical protein CL947_02935 [Epsilonproteobacteria bacterium]|nr:hypothetical protein [Campylobacterota bacterium]|tara:strand:+ start:1691 stop:2065 length:375 start_codon:yes stop_codon:yes gene_type:complete
MHVSNFLSKLLKVSKSSSVIFTSVLTTTLVSGVLHASHQTQQFGPLAAFRVNSSPDLYGSKSYTSEDLSSLEPQDYSDAHQIEKSDPYDTPENTYLGIVRRQDGNYKKYKLPDGLIRYFGPMDE